MIELQTIFYAALGGILPALIWLAFWLHEDFKRPEPRRLVFKTFILGMLAVIIVLPFQKGVEMFLPWMTVSTIVLWVVFEELFKFGAAWFGGLKSAEDNEPLDPLVYMITSALGFAALENTLFIFAPVVGQDLTDSLITGNLRFIGASLLHVVSSGIIGATLAFSFYKSRRGRRILTILAIILAVLFHASFNLLIIHWNALGAMIAFISVWIGTILLLLAFEKAKTIAP